MESLNSSAYRACDIQESTIQASMLGYGFTVGGGGIEFPEGCIVPVTRAENDRDDLGGAFSVSLHRSCHFDVVAVVGVEQVRTHQV